MRGRRWEAAHLEEGSLALHFHILIRHSRLRGASDAWKSLEDVRSPALETYQDSNGLGEIRGTRTKAKARLNPADENSFLGEVSRNSNNG